MSGNTQVTLKMQIAGFDVDPLSEQQDEYAATSWIAKQLLEQQNIKTTNTSLISNYKFVYGNVALKKSVYVVFPAPCGPSTTIIFEFAILSSNF